MLRISRPAIGGQVTKGVSIYIVQGLLGHANVRATQRYAHLASETLSDAAEFISAVVVSAASSTLCLTRSRMGLSNRFKRHLETAA
jgi:hypothetical protein